MTTDTSPKTFTTQYVIGAVFKNPQATTPSFDGWRVYISPTVTLPASPSTQWFSLTTAIAVTGYTNLAPTSETDFTLTTKADEETTSGVGKLIPYTALTGWTAPSTGSTGAATPSFCT